MESHSYSDTCPDNDNDCGNDGGGGGGGSGGDAVEEGEEGGDEANSTDCVVFRKGELSFAVRLLGTFD